MPAGRIAISPTPHRYSLSLDASELHDGMAFRDAENLVDLRMVMKKIIDAVAPRAAPPISGEQRINACCGIVAARERDGAPIKQQGPTRMIGDDAVILEMQALYHASPNHAAKGSFVGLVLDQLARQIFDLVRQRHNYPLFKGFVKRPCR